MKPVQSINLPKTPGLAKSDVEHVDNIPPIPPAILRLPRELRDLIYEHYVQVDGGYIHNFETNRLLRADGSPISTGLGLTCRQIAAEMQGLALGQNTITFYTHFSESSRQQAGLFQMTMYTLMFRKKVQLQHLIPRLLSYDMVQRAIGAYPQFARIFDGWMPHQSIIALHQRDFDCGEAPSTWDDFIQYVFHLLSKHPAFHDEMVPMPRTWKPGEVCDLRALSETSPAPWLIPDLPDLSRLASIADVEPGVPMYYPRPEYRHSAASVALRFLHAIPSSSLSQVRTVILQEECESGVNAASHGRGFIPLCQFNRRLRVQRIVNMWSSVFRPRPASRIDYVTAMGGDTPDRMKDDRLYSSTITKAVETWIAEAQALPSLGMPRDSLSVLLDGSPTIEHT
ncbi:hypothetical protein J4E81_006484 [Alternaria sp. BMP 2799]|nr:hypothetical protein J4E81_006484 [Alternaria sp. BMP 2799]